LRPWLVPSGQGRSFLPIRKLFFQRLFPVGGNSLAPRMVGFEKTHGFLPFWAAPGDSKQFLSDPVFTRNFYPFWRFK